jgi:hypothetical protein
MHSYEFCSLGEIVTLVSPFCLARLTLKGFFGEEDQCFGYIVDMNA